MNDEMPSGEGEPVEEVPDEAEAPSAPLPSFEEAEHIFKKLQRKGLAVAQGYRTIATVNESFYSGDHWGVLTSEGGTVKHEKSAWFDSEKVPRIFVNLFTGLMQTWCALLTSDRPTVSAVPASGEPEDTYRAAMAQKGIEHAQQEVDSAQKVDETVGHAARGGTAGIKIAYMADVDNITWKPVSIHDFLVDPAAEDPMDSPWVIFEDHVSEDDAATMLEEAGIKDHEPTEKDYRSAAGDELTGIERHELWHKPTRKWGAGFYACFVDGRCVEVTIYPYVFGNESDKPEYLLPLVTMQVRKQRGSVYGRTNFTDAVPLQRAYNEIVARTQKIIRTTSMIVMKVPAEIAEDFKPGDDTLLKFPSNKAQAAREIGFTNPPEISQAIFAQRDFFAASMEQVVGINSLTSGSQGRSLSGRAIEHIVELDQNRNADCTRSLQRMIRAAFRLHLALMGRYYTTLRKMKITNGDDVEVFSFVASDIDGVDVRLEPASELDSTSSRKEAIANERAQAGLVGPEAIAQAQNQPSLEVARATVEQMFDAFSQGYPINELPGDISEEAVADFVQRKKAQALAQGDMGLWVNVERFATAVRDLLARVTDARPVQPVAEQQPEQPQPGGMVPPVGVM